MSKIEIILAAVLGVGAAAFAVNKITEAKRKADEDKNEDCIVDCDSCEYRDICEVWNGSDDGDAEDNCEASCDDSDDDYCENGCGNPICCADCENCDIDWTNKEFMDKLIAYAKSEARECCGESEIEDGADS